MQTSSFFRFLSAVVAILLLAALVLVIRLVILSNPSDSVATVPTVMPTATQMALNQTQGTTVTSLETPIIPTATATRASIEALLSTQPTSTTRPATATMTRTDPRPTRIRVTQTPTQLASKPTRTATSRPMRPPTRTPLPMVVPTKTPISIAAEQPAGQWWLYSNANYVNDLAILGDTIWMATGGGVVALNPTEGRTTKYTTLDGLSYNDIRVAETCLLPGMGAIFGTEAGLQIFDIENERWSTWTSANSSLFFDDISALYCDADNGFLIIGYQDNGLDILDTIAGTWIHLDDETILADNAVHHIAVVGDQASIWVVSDFGVTGITPVTGLSDNPNAVFYSTVHYDVINSPLETTEIQAIAAYEDGTVWIGASNRLYKVQDQNWTLYNSDVVLQSEFPTGELQYLSLESDGTLWIGSSLGELCRFDPLFESCIDFLQAETIPLTSLLTSSNGGVLYSTAGDGIQIYDGQAWTQHTIPNEVLNSNTVRSIVQSNDGSIWIATTQGIQRLQAESGILTGQEIPNDIGLLIGETTILYPDIAGGVWIGATGLHYYDGINWVDYTVEDGLVGLNIQAIAMDNLERLWIGTDVGLSILSESGFFNLTQETGLTNHDILAIIPTKESMWIGTNGGGLLRFVNNQLQFFNANNAGLSSNTITAIAQADEDALWVGTDQGLVYFTNNQATEIPAIPSVAVTAIAKAENGDLWVGTENSGIFYFDLDTEDWTQLTPTDGLPTQQITTILIDQEGTVWIGGKHGGMVRYVP